MDTNRYCRLSLIGHGDGAWENSRWKGKRNAYQSNGLSAVETLKFNSTHYLCESLEDQKHSYHSFTKEATNRQLHSLVDKRKVPATRANNPGSSIRSIRGRACRCEWSHIWKGTLLECILSFHVWLSVGITFPLCYRLRAYWEMRIGDWVFGSYFVCWLTSPLTGKDLAVTLSRLSLMHDEGQGSLKIPSTGNKLL